MANKTIKLSNIKPGTYLSWFATTQAAFETKMVLKDNKKVYFDATRKSTNINPPMAIGSAWYEGEGLEIYIEVSDAQQIDLNAFINTFTLLTPEGEEVGYSFTCCGEDQHDKDYNDFYLNVMAWKGKG
ncbi:MAG: hypothetical protein LBE35_03490 [Clostridiales bacterium]|jgi:hypothetical protein|nr:hypothetical protein [Clostridiales bacterium]